jgi:O-antigen ligase
VSDEWLLEWKFGYGPLLTMSIAIFMGVAGPGLMGRVGALALIAAGLVHLQSNARSLGGLSIFIGMISLLAEYFSRNLRDRSSALSARFLVPVFLFIFSIYQVYTYGASSGLFGEKTQEKYNKQTAEGRNVISGARMEYTIAIPAIIESPVFGYGSWARNQEWVKKYIYINKMDPTAYDAEFLMELGIIPTHSHILGSWAEAGFMGGVFWFVVLYLAAVSFIGMLKHVDMPFRAFLLFIVGLFIWDILFSPFGLERRILDPASIVLLASVRAWMRDAEESEDSPLSDGTEEDDETAFHPMHAPA